MKRGARVALAATGVAMVPLVVAAWSVGAVRQQRDVPMPSIDAGPTRVVTVFLDALDARDCATARRMLSGTSTLGETWCRDVAALDVVSVGRTEPLDAGRVRVPVAVDLDWRWLHDDEDRPSGRVRWTYTLDRYSSSSPWRIVDQGAA